MKKLVLLSLGVAAVLSWSNVSMAAKSVAKEVKEKVTREMKDRLEKRYGKGATEAGALAKMGMAQRVKGNQMQARELRERLSGIDENSIVQAIGMNGNRARVVETLIMTDNVVRQAEKTKLDANGRAEVASMKKSVDLIGRLIAQSTKLLNTNSPEGQAYLKMETLFDKMLTQFNLAERNSFNQILESTLNNINGGTTLEQAFVNAIKQVEGIKDTAALMKKLNEILNCRG